jgi:hypothetical protein
MGEGGEYWESLVGGKIRPHLGEEEGQIKRKPVC